MSIILEDLPVEILSRILLFVEDVDLQTLTRVSKALRILACDIPVLWRLYIFSMRNPSRVSKSLNVPQRPQITQLASQNIIQGPTGLVRQIESGEFINWNLQTAMFEAQQVLKRKLTERLLSAKLQKRPPIVDLCARNVVPEEAIKRQNSSSFVFAKNGSESGRAASVVADGNGFADEIAHDAEYPGSGCSPKLLSNVVQLQRAIRKDKITQLMRQKSQELEVYNPQTL
ncbi:hypothetical protein HK098_004984 [Nowakowskiella sp. JEL0407]|nr:hypothetical protein HK098_004984 [Nowakowskiella sp. JEL0407]